MSLYLKLENVSKFYALENKNINDDSLSTPNHKVGKLDNIKLAVNDVTLSINEGDRLGIVGRNGAGKSTLLHLLAGISSPTSGCVKVNGKVTSIMTLGVGLRDDLTGRQNIYIDGEIQGKSKEQIDRVIDEIISFSELEKHIDKPIKTYSTGMKARLAFSMISYIEPEILIIDEALSVGDSKFSSKATQRIKEICDKGKIVVIVSHGMDSIRQICNRCIYLKDGKIIMDGHPDKVTEAYIEEVQSEDNNLLISEFTNNLGTHSHKNGYGFDTLEILSKENKLSMVVQTNEKIVIKLKGFVESNEGMPRIKLKIIRFDDLVVFSQDFTLSEYLVSHNHFSMKVVFEQFSLSSGNYKLQCSMFLNEADKVLDVAEVSSAFEVICTSVTSGGKPALVYPNNISVRKVQ